MFKTLLIKNIGRCHLTLKKTEPLAYEISPYFYCRQEPYPQ